jgi:hypothetical protein
MAGKKRESGTYCWGLHTFMDHTGCGERDQAFKRSGDLKDL